MPPFSISTYHCFFSDTDNKKSVSEDKGWHKMVYSHKVKCVICKKVLKNESAHTKHHRNKHQGEPYTCQLCDKSFSERDGYYRHKTQSHNKPFGCNTCDYTASKVIMMKNHIQRIHIDKVQKWARNKSNSVIEITPMGSNEIEKVNETSISNNKADRESGDNSGQQIETKNLAESIKKSPKKLMVNIKPLRLSELVDKEDISFCNLNNTVAETEQVNNEKECNIKENNTVSKETDMNEDIDEHENRTQSDIEDDNYCDIDNTDNGANDDGLDDNASPLNPSGKNSEK